MGAWRKPLWRKETGRFHAAVPQLDPPADPDEYLFYLIGQCARRREAAMAEPFKSLGMSHAKWRVLTMIYRIDGLTMGELASFDAVDRTTLTRTVDQLPGGSRPPRGRPQRPPTCASDPQSERRGAA